MRDTVPMFEALTLAEKLRLVRHAKSKGYAIPMIEEETRGLEPEALVTIPAKDMLRSNFPGADDETFEALQSYYASTEDQGESYPPLGYCPSLREQECNAVALFDYMVTAVEKDHGQDQDNYPIVPIQRVEADARIEPAPGFLRRSLTFLFG